MKDSETTLSKSDIYVYLDGEEIKGFTYQRSTGSLSFTPSKLSSGPHKVEIEADSEGSRTARKRVGLGTSQILLRTRGFKLDYAFVITLGKEQDGR